MVRGKKKNLKDQPHFLNKAGLENERNIQFIDSVLAIILIIAVGVLPLLVRVKLVEFVSPKIMHDLVNSGIKADIFSYYKFAFLVFLTVMALILLLWKIIACRYQLRRSYINIPLMVLVLMTLLSGLLSEFPGLSLFGMYNRHEGALTYLCYFLLFFVAANTNFKEWFKRYVFIALYVLVSINLTIILFGFYGKDLLNNPLVRSLIVPSFLPGTGIQGQLNSTLSNPNYVSGFSAALMIFFLTASILEEDFRRKAVHAVFAVGSFAMLLASLSTSGFLTVVVLMPAIIVLAFMNRRRLQGLITSGAVLAACAILLFIMNWQNPRVWDESVGSFKGLLSTGIKTSYIQDLKYVLLPKAFAAATPSTEAKNMQSDTDDFTLPAPSFSPGTGRLYIWQKTMDLIKQKPLLGYGHDTLTYYFPQDDYYKVANLRSYDEIVTKSHNFYLDLLYSSGVVAFLSFTVLFAVFLYTNLRNLMNDTRKGRLKVFQTALFAFACAFLVQWVFNDSIIATSVVFWVLAGVLVSLNRDTT